MPIYLSTIEPGRSNERKRMQIAKCITKVHVDITGAPARFVNAFFSEQADQEAGFHQVPPGKVIYVNANIRSGRSPAAKSQLVGRITKGIVTALACRPEEVCMAVTSGPASHGMEGGRLLPEPGSPEERAWKNVSHVE